jgi:hypothetical protein
MFPALLLYLSRLRYRWVLLHLCYQLYLLLLHPWILLLRLNLHLGLLRRPHPLHRLLLLCLRLLRR